MVGERGFEPPTPWSRTGFRQFWKFVEFYGFQLFYIERLAHLMRHSVVSCGSWRI